MTHLILGFSLLSNEEDLLGLAGDCVHSPVAFLVLAFDDASFRKFTTLSLSNPLVDYKTGSGRKCFCTDKLKVE